MRTYLVSNVTPEPRFIYSRVTFLLGAGASYYLGYPLVKEFLSSRYLRWLCDQCAAVPAGRRPPEELLSFLLSESEYLRTLSDNIEEVLNLSMNIPTLHQRVIGYIYEILSCIADMASVSRQSSSTAEHLLLASMILDLCRVGECTVITFNWDTAIEDAISFLSSLIESWTPGSRYFHYGYPKDSVFNLFTDALNLSGTQLPVTYPAGRVPVLKLHGSLNTLVCHSCGSIHYAPFEVIPQPPLTTMKECMCCGAEALGFLIVPPGKRKSLPPALAGLWSNAEQALKRSQIVLLAGYSVPEYDLEARLLLKSTLRDKEVLLVDPFPREESVLLIQAAGPANLTVLRQTLSNFLQNEATRYEPQFIPVISSLCNSRYLYPERLEGHAR